jgi:hypothetical protein
MTIITIYCTVLQAYLLKGDVDFLGTLGGAQNILYMKCSTIFHCPLENQE